jgi:hypothetical protein
MKFAEDYLISWDFSDKDLPCVEVMLLHSDQKGTKVIGEHLGTSYEKSGVISLNQLLSKHFSEKTFEELEKLRKFIKEQNMPTEKKE